MTSVTTESAYYAAQRTNQHKVTLADDFSQFLTLLTTQLQNQDPLSPMDSTEFTNQLVQFSQVEQQINQNQKLDDLVALQMSNMSSLSLGYVGLDVSYLSAEFNFEGKDQPIELYYALPQDAGKAKMHIYNENGSIVYSSDVPRSTGKHNLSWDGKLTNGGTAEAGTYTVKIEALSSATGEPMDTATVVKGRVRGVETQNGTLFVLVGERAVPISNVLNAMQPNAPVQNSDNDNNNNSGDTDIPPDDNDENGEA